MGKIYNVEKSQSLLLFLLFYSKAARESILVIWLTQPLDRENAKNLDFSERYDILSIFLKRVSAFTLIATKHCLVIFDLTASLSKTLSKPTYLHSKKKNWSLERFKKEN